MKNEEFLKLQYKRKTDRRVFGAKLVRAALELFPVSSKLIQPNVHIHPQTHMTQANSRRLQPLLYSSTVNTVITLI